jgi:hypothetical protein
MRKETTMQNIFSRRIGFKRSYYFGGFLKNPKFFFGWPSRVNPFCPKGKMDGLL